MSLDFLGWATALPAHGIDQSSAARLATTLTPSRAENARRLAALYRRSGVRRRYSALLTASPEDDSDPLFGQSFYRPAPIGSDNGAAAGPTTERRMATYARCAPDLAARASDNALRAAALDPAAITHLVTVSCSGFHAPGVDIELVGRLGLPVSVERTHIGFMGCHGALNGLRVARAFCEAEPSARVLLCAVELCSLHFQFSDDPEQQVANSLFADGAAALVAVRSAGASAAARDRWHLSASGSCVIPDSLDAMSWSIGDHGFTMTLSPRVPSLVHEALAAWLRHWLARHGRRLEDVASWAVHPGGPRILSAVEAALGLPRSACAVSRAVLAECGNMSSPTVLFILKRLIDTGAPRPCVALAFGPGLVVEAALFA